MWSKRSNVSPGSPTTLPISVPTEAQIDFILTDFLREFRQLEHLLNAERQKSAKNLRETGINKIYQDLSKPRALPVQTLVNSRSAKVTQISPDHTQLTIEPALQEGEPIFHEGVLFEHSGYQDGALVCDPQHQVEVGSILTQHELIGDFHDVCKAFKAFWDPMWNRRANCPVDRWQEAIQLVGEHLPKAEAGLQLEPITRAEWKAAAQAKKPRSATGPDGVSRLDILNLPDNLTDILLTVINQCDRAELAWPEVANVGLIACIEKHSQGAESI